MAMNQASLAKLEDRVKAGGVLAYNATLIDTPPKRGDVRIIKIPANEIATELGNPQVANLVAAGGLVTALGVISLVSLYLIEVKGGFNVLIYGLAHGIMECWHAAQAPALRE